MPSATVCWTLRWRQWWISKIRYEYQGRAGHFGAAQNYSEKLCIASIPSAPRFDRFDLRTSATPMRLGTVGHGFTASQRLPVNRGFSWLGNHFGRTSNLMRRKRHVPLEDSTSSRRPKGSNLSFVSTLVIRNFVIRNLSNDQELGFTRPVLKILKCVQTASCTGGAEEAPLGSPRFEAQNKKRFWHHSDNFFHWRSLRHTATLLWKSSKVKKWGNGLCHCVSLTCRDYRKEDKRNRLPVQSPWTPANTQSDARSRRFSIQFGQCNHWPCARLVYSYLRYQHVQGANWVARSLSTFSFHSIHWLPGEPTLRQK